MSQKHEAIPEVLLAETTEPTDVDTKIEKLTKRVGWIWMLGGVVLALLGMGASSYRIVSRLATKDDLNSAMKAHAEAHNTTPSDRIVVERLVQRLDENDVWRASLESKYISDVKAIKESMEQLSHTQEKLLDVILRDRHVR